MSTQDQDIKQQYGSLNKLFEHRTRLAICALLNRYEKISFSRFKELLNETDGNLGAQLRKLEDASYLEVSKEFVARRPVSWYSITEAGKQAVHQHMDALEGMFGK